MTAKRFTNIEHDYENAWIKCNDDGDFMIYAIYKELDESLPSLEDLLNGLSEENEQLQSRINDYDVALKRLQDLTERKIKENEQLKQENKRMTDKLNQLALEFLNYNMVTMGKATEISEMCYYDFLKYRKENGNPMELQL